MNRVHFHDINFDMISIYFARKLAITIGVRILGPAAGFILGSFCTRYYVDLTNPGFGPSDPKWVGAWYLGKHSE